jgi:hypothetical protein
MISGQWPFQTLQIFFFHKYKFSSHTSRVVKVKSNKKRKERNNMGSELEILVNRAKDGNKESLEALVLRIQDRIYGLALRMLYNPSDAEDASQEILLKIITHLSTFRGESAFTTWMFRVAVNHLLTQRKRRAELEAVSFEEFEKSLELAGVSFQRLTEYFSGGDPDQLPARVAALPG